MAVEAGAPFPFQQNREKDMTEVRNGDVVRIHYTAKTTDGAEFASSGQEPLELQVGAGQVIAGLDRRIDGMTVGEMSTVTVPAEEGYGLRDDAKLKTVSRSAVPDSTEVGAKLQASTRDGRKIALTVVDVDDEKVTVDANHPLAGRDLVFDVEVVEIVATAA
jgi:peptidylprolyl isomerase